MARHHHKWGPIEVSRFAGTVHRKCQVPGCKAIAIPDEDDEEAQVVIETTYVAVDITGRLSGDENTLDAAKGWMEEHNPNSGDCVIWGKPKDKTQEPFIAAIRKGKVWHTFTG